MLGDALRARLTPWLSHLDMDPFLRFEDDAQPHCGVCVSATTAFQGSMDDGAPLFHAHCVMYSAQRLREAIEIVQLLLALEPLCVWSDVASPYESAKLEALTNGAPVELQLSITVKDPLAVEACRPSLREAVLASWDNKSTTTDESFTSVRSELKQLMAAKSENGKGQVCAVRVEFVVVFSSQLACNASLHMAALGRFLKDLVKAKARPYTRRDVQLAAVPVQLDFRFVPITPQLSKASQALLEVPGMFECEKVTIDPLDVSCSQQEWTAFLTAAASGARPGLRVDTEESRDYRRGFETPIGCDAFIRGVADCDRVRKIDVDGLVAVYQTPTSRSILYRAILDTLFTRELPVDVAFLRTHLNQSHSRSLREQTQQWKSSHPEALLRIHKLSLLVRERHHTFAEAVVDTLDSVDKISLCNCLDEAPPMPPRLVETIVAKFPHLRKIELVHVHIESMDVFLDPPLQCLRKLVLGDLELTDQSSLGRFAAALGDPSTVLAQNLLEFSIFETDDRDVAFQIRSSNGLVLAMALQTNWVLQSVSLIVYDRYQRHADAVKEELESTANRLVSMGPHHRLYAEEKSRKRAFLSVVHHTCLAFLDAALVAQILAFAAPCVKREIEIIARATYLEMD